MKPQIKFSPILKPLAFTLMVILIGVFGYMLIEGFKLVEAFYMTIITISTVGFKEVKELSVNGQIFTAILIIFTFGIFAYSVNLIGRSIVNGELKTFYKNYRMEKKIQDLKNHVIVCGYGRHGKASAKELTAKNKSFVIIEKDEKIIETIKPGTFYIHGDASVEEVLIKAGIKNAEAIISTLQTDSDNVFVVLTVRELNPNILIIARGANEHSIKKLKRAGANNVVMPDTIGGSLMASLVLTPDMLEFWQLISTSSTSEVNLEEIDCKDLGDNIIGKSIMDLNIRSQTGANLIGLKNKNEEYIINPVPEKILDEQSKLFVLCTPQQLKKIKQLYFKEQV